MNLIAIVYFINSCTQSYLLAHKVMSATVNFFLILFMLKSSPHL